MTKSTHTVGGRAAGVKNPNPTHRRQQFDIIRELMHGPKTVKQLAELVDVSENTLRESLNLMQEAGISYQEGMLKGRGHNRTHHLCTKPFEVPGSAMAAAEGAVTPARLRQAAMDELFKWSRPGSATDQAARRAIVDLCGVLGVVL